MKTEKLAIGTIVHAKLADDGSSVLAKITGYPLPNQMVYDVEEVEGSMVEATYSIRHAEIVRVVEE